MMIELHQITKSFGQKRVLTNVNLTIESGYCTALIGNNGAGKSTLVEILVGNLKATSGILIDKDDLLNDNNRGVMYQKTRFPKFVKVKELVKLYQSFYPSPLSDKEFLAITKFNDQQMNQYARLLSGGQQRLLDFALTLIGKPRVLILDEPTASMDIATREHFWKIIAELKLQNITILYTSHYIEEVERMADKVILIEGGDVTFNDSLQKIKHQQQSQIKVPSFYQLKVKNGDTYQISQQPSGDVIINTTDVDEVLLLLKKQQVNLNDIEISKVSLIEIMFNNSKKVGEQLCS